MIEIKQIIFNSCLYLAGFIFLSCGFSFSIHLKHLMAYLVGAALLSVVSTFCLITSIHLDLTSISLIFIVLITPVVFFKRQKFIKLKGEYARKEFLFFIAYFSLFILINITVSYFNYVKLTWDSWRFIGTGELIGKIGYFPPSERLGDCWNMLLHSHMPFLPILYAACYLSSIDLFYTIFPISGIYFLFIFPVLSYIVSEPLGLSKRYRIFLGILGSMLIVTIPAYWYHMYYIHAHLLVCIYFTIGIFSIFIYRNQRNRMWLNFASIILGATTLMRTEMFLFAIIPIAILMSTKDLKKKDYLVFLAIFLSISFSWQLFKMYHLGLEKNIHNWGSVEIAIGLSYIISYFILHFGITREKIASSAPNILISILAIFIISSLYHSPEVTTKTITNLIQIILTSNFSQGSHDWGVIWLTIAVFMGIDLVFIKEENLKPFMKVLAIFFLIRIIIYSIVLTFDYSQFHSGSRILLHIMPIGVFYISCLTAHVLQQLHFHQKFHWYRPKIKILACALLPRRQKS